MYNGCFLSLKCKVYRKYLGFDGTKLLVLGLYHWTKRRKPIFAKETWITLESNIKSKMVNA